MLIYQPTTNAIDRVAWYVLSPTQLHYQQQVTRKDGSVDWLDTAIRELEDGIPHVSELHAELVDFYNYCQVATLD